jgi:hypothetical protein
MNVYIKSYYGNNMPDNIISDVINFCKKAEQETSQHAHENMCTVDWQHKSNTLLHTIFRQKRYDENNGKFFLCYCNDALAAVSGCYTYENDSTILICGVRCWTLPEYRVKYLHGSYIFPAQFEWGEQEGYRMGMFTFNEYNLPLRNFLKRITQNKMTAPGLPNNEIYKDLEFPEDHRIIKNTKQWVAIKNFKGK